MGSKCTKLEIVSIAYIFSNHVQFTGNCIVKLDEEACGSLSLHFSSVIN